EADHKLAKREKLTWRVIGSAGSDAAKGLIEAAANEAGRQLEGLFNALWQWDDAREEFTKRTTAGMWARNPDYRRYPAAICYNKGYRLRNPSGIAARVSEELKLEPLHTNYDCMYMTGNNAFWTDSDGGYINLSYTYDSNRCSFDGSTGDLTC
ncbi:hypothetical protein B0I35DRAFT_336208, partial [Stachybotrys elegans]